MIHQLKLKSKYFEYVISGKKTFELRLDDRDYNEGDYLALNEVDDSGIYTDRSCMVYVDYILKDVPNLLPEGIVCMAIKPCRLVKTQAENESLVAAPKYWNAVPVLTNVMLRDPKNVAEVEMGKAMLKGLIKAEAVKEFAARLKAEYADFDEENEEILPENLNMTIDDLLKEMACDDN